MQKLGFWTANILGREGGNCTKYIMHDQHKDLYNHSMCHTIWSIGGAVIVQNLILPIPCLHKSLLHTTHSKPTSMPTSRKSFPQKFSPHNTALPHTHHTNSSHISIYCGGHTMYRYAVHLVLSPCFKFRPCLRLVTNALLVFVIRPIL